MQHTYSNNKYRPDIDGLRAVAVSSVVIFHAFPKYLKGGFIGVDIFFVISGFLITSIILNNLKNNSFDFFDFYARRVKRIFPALLLMLTACYVFGWFYLLPDEFKQLGKHIASGVGFVANIVYWSESGYFDSSAGIKPLLHLWSLGVEEQFYILFPLIMWASWKMRLNIFIVLLVLFACSFLLNIFYIYNFPEATFYFLPTRAWEMISGGVLAYLVMLGRSEGNLKLFTYGNGLNKALRSSLSVVGLTLLIVGFCFIEEGKSFPGWLAAIPVFGAVFIILSGQDTWINKNILSNKVFVWFGLISFPLYLWHWPLLVFPRLILGEEPSVAVRLVAVALAIIFSWITLKVVEKPLRHGGRAVTISLIVVAAFTGLIGAAIYKYDGFGGRHENMEIMISQFGWNGDQKDNLCIKNIDANSEFCRISKDTDPSIILIGDSISWQLFFGLSDQTKDKFSSVLAYSQGGCAAFFGFSERFDFKNCLEVTLKALDIAKSSENVKTVIFSSTPRVYSEGAHPLDLGYGMGEKEKFASKEDFMAHVDATFSGIMRDLIKSGKRIVFVKNNPLLNFDPKKCVSRPLKPVDGSSCTEPYSEHVKNTAEYNNMLDSLIKKFPEIKVFDPANVLCDKSENVCSPIKNGKMLYRDIQHLSIDGSIYVGKPLYEIIKK